MRPRDPAEPGLRAGGINSQPGAEYRVRANNEAGADATGTTRVEFCADDPPAEGECGAEDEQGTTYTIVWGPEDGAPPPDGEPGRP